MRFLKDLVDHKGFVGAVTATVVGGVILILLTPLLTGGNDANESSTTTTETATTSQVSDTAAVAVTVSPSADFTATSAETPESSTTSDGGEPPSSDLVLSADDVVEAWNVASNVQSSGAALAGTTYPGSLTWSAQGRTEKWFDWAIGAQHSRFCALAGVDDAKSAAEDSVQLIVLIDNAQVYETVVSVGNPLPVDIEFEPGIRLRLLSRTATSNTIDSTVVWANAKLTNNPCPSYDLSVDQSSSDLVLSADDVVEAWNVASNVQSSGAALAGTTYPGSLTWSAQGRTEKWFDWAIGAQHSRFCALAGVDDAKSAAEDSVQLIVLIDNAQVYETVVSVGNPLPVDIEFEPGIRLRLLSRTATSNTIDSTVVWANAKLTNNPCPS